MEPMLFGEVLLNFNLVTEEQLEECIALQQSSDEPRPLGEILVERGLIDSKTLSTILSVQQSRVGKTQQKESDLVERLRDAKASDLLRIAKEIEASDLYLSSGEKPLARVHGHLVELPAAPISFEECRKLIFSLLTPEQVSEYYERKQLDVSIFLPESGRFRANVFRHWGGIAAVFRIIPDKVMPFAKLGLPKNVREFVDFSHGLVLVTGSTGSGKSTTLASLIDLINRGYKQHVITLEDPIETVFRSREALITQREIHKHAESFGTALRAALREDADVLVVGEMRDPDTMATALIAAETGHLVFGTLHTRNAFNTIIRIVDQFPANQRAHVRTMLAGTLRAVVCQELIPNVDGKGRSLACEVMMVNQASANLIREDRMWQIPMVMQTATSRGMQLMDDSLERLVRGRKIPIEEALSRASDRTRFVAAKADR
jgi:twitching motility protein PilT